MKQIKLVVLSLAALFTGRRAGFCTSNAATPADPLAELKAEMDALKQQNAAQAEQIAKLNQLASVPAEPATADDSLTRLCKGSEVDIADVRWRIAAGLDAEQAVEAAIAQKKHNAHAAAKAAADAEAAKKAAKK